MDRTTARRGALRFHPTEKEVGGRIDAVVAARLAAPRGAVQVALKAGAVTVGGELVRASYRLVEGDEVDAVVHVTTQEAPQAEDIPITVRYSDDRVLVVSKPPGLVTHPAAGHPTGTLVNALMALPGTLSSIDPMRPGIVHRLDKDTSGLCLVARDDDAHQMLATALQARIIGRSYLALVRGRLRSEAGTIDAPIGRHSHHKTRQAVVAEGRASVTHYRVLQATAKCSLLDVSLETGRTHQIRVHLSHINHPILGDGPYGGRNELSVSLGLHRPFLHAYKLVFPHPTTGELVEVTDGLPEDLAAALEAAGMEPFHTS